MAPNQKLTKVIANRVIKSVRQSDALMAIEFADGSIMQIKLAGPTDSVFLRDGKGAMEYAD